MVSAKAVGAGAFVVLGALVFGAVLFMIGQRRMLFEDRFAVQSEFATLGRLDRGAIVRVAGLTAGQVVGIETPDSPAQRFRVRMEVRQDLRPLIRTDSVATIQTEGLIGGTYVNIAPGSENAPAVADGGTIPGREPFVLADLLQQTSDAVRAINGAVQRVSDDMERTVEQVALTAEGARVLVAEVSPRIRSIAEDGARISEDARRMVGAVESGQGTLGKLIRDESLYQALRQTTEESAAVMGHVRQATDEARRAIADFRSVDGPAGGLYADMRMTLSHAREATADLADNMEALKRNFFLRGFFNKRGYFDLDAISPAEYRAGVLERDRRRAARIWLSSGVIFERGPDGREVLTAGGRARIDSAVDAFLEYLPASPLVIEGYAASSPPGDRFAASRRRAGIVREYLLARYQLMPQHTGFIALGAEADGSPDGDRWDGIAVTLFLDPRTVRIAAQEQQGGAKPPPTRAAK